MALTGKMQRFCEEFIIDHNATDAYIRAGYSKNRKVAMNESSKLRKQPRIQKEIERLEEKLRNRSALTADMIINELRMLGFWNMQDFVGKDNEVKDITKLSRRTTVPVAGIKSKTISYVDANGKTVTETQTELKMHDKRGALTDLGKHLGIFEKDNEQKGLKIKVTRK